MCKETVELMTIIDEMASAAASMSQGAQSYDVFIRARDKCREKIHESFESTRKLSTAIKNLQDLV